MSLIQQYNDIAQRCGSM